MERSTITNEGLCNLGTDTRQNSNQVSIRMLWSNQWL